MLKIFEVVGDNRLITPQMTIVGGKKAPLTNKSGAKIDKQATLKAGRLRKFETSAGAVGKAQKTLRSATATKEQRDRAKATIKRAAEKMRSGGSGIPFEKLHPRYPKGSPGGKGGKFMPKGSAEYKATVANNLAVEVASGKATLSEARQAAKEAGITTPPKKPELGEELGAMFKEADRIGKKYQDEPEAAPAKKTKAKAKQPATDAAEKTSQSVKEAEAKPTELEAPAKVVTPKGKGVKAGKPKKITSYDEFKSEAMKAYDQIAYDFNYENLVPIHRLREAIGDRMTRSEFDQWLSKLNSDKVIKLGGGTGADINEAQKKNSYTDSLGTTSYYITAKNERPKEPYWSTAPKNPKSKIKTYEDFKEKVMEVHGKLDEGGNNTLVPIYKIRRAIGDDVSRTNFKDWLLKMQKDGIFQLQSTGIEDNAPDKKEDSIMTEASGLRCYVRKKQK